MRRHVFTADHEAFREVARDFLEKEVVPRFSEWKKNGQLRATSSPVSVSSG
jgi:acyl-CoA dehydrogenase